MSPGRSGSITAFALCFLGVGVAHAQSPPTCSFDAATGTATVTVNGERANLSVVTGTIRLNTAGCGSPNLARVTNTEVIVVTGGDLNDVVGIAGTERFTPGRTVEEDGFSEIEFVLDLGGGVDLLVHEHQSGSILTFTPGGIDAGNDGDEDFATAGVEKLRAEASFMDASLYAGGGTLFLTGRPGVNTIIGSGQADVLLGGVSDDVLVGGGGNDRITDGVGNDDCDGGAGDDRFIQEPSADGSDSFDGGTGMDTVDYSERAVGVEVSIGNGLADDGQPGVELDEVDISVENVDGGRGGDLIVGSATDNAINGGDGDDELYGEGGRDEIHAGRGSDIVVGDAGRDNLYGDEGMDSLDGGIGNDNLFGGPGADTITGGAGTDDIFGEASNDIIFNSDGQADNVDCGGGAADDPEPDPLDTFTNCENI